jgi:hypothetical protein
VAIGAIVDVRLNGAHSSWSALSEVGPRLLAPVGTGRHAAGTIEVSYRAIESGRTTLRAFERPLCQPGRPCPQFILLWQVDLRVKRR